MTEEELFTEIATRFKVCLDSKLKTKLTEIKVAKLPAEERMKAIKVYCASMEDLEENHEGWEDVASMLSRRLFYPQDAKILRRNLQGLKGAKSADEVVELLDDPDKLKALMICLTINCLTKYCFIKKERDEKEEQV